MLSACQLLSPVADVDADAAALDATQFLAAAVEAEPARREKLWHEARGAPRTADGRLRKAVLQSLPGHSGYDPDAAERSLKGLAAKDSPPDIGAVARIRLATLHTQTGCHDEVEALRKRLAAIADIERQLDRNGK